MIVAVGVLGARYGPAVRILDLGHELTIPAAVSGGLLAAAALAAFIVARLGLRDGFGGVSAVALGSFFVLMALDEMLYLHERLETVTGIDWQILYLPLVLVGAVAWLAMIRRLWSHPLAAALFASGAAAWLASQVFEAVQWDGDVLVYRWMNVPEELLEMTGSALFALGLLSGLQASLRAADGRPGSAAIAVPLRPRRHAGLPPKQAPASTTGKKV